MHVTPNDHQPTHTPNIPHGLLTRIPLLIKYFVVIAIAINPKHHANKKHQKLRL